MLRAEQLALIQEANQQLLAIRQQEMQYYVNTFSSFDIILHFLLANGQQEMQYYVNTFSSFGTQGSLIAGFTLGI